MPTEMLAAHATRAMRRWWPEALLAVLAGVVFLGCLGSVDLWGKREQRASAEAIDTVDHQHWLVAQIQGRPRLEKPPLPRWSIAALMVLTGRRDEWIVRLPGAFSALATVALIYFLGRRIGGRPVGLASALVLCSLGFYVGEMRQASNDGPLALFTTLALCAAWCRLHVDDDPADKPARRSLGAWVSWNLVLYAALGLGILTKGPVILLLVGVTVIPYLAISGKLALGPAPAGRRSRSVAVRHDGIDLAGRRPAARSERPRCLVARDVGEDGSVADLSPYSAHVAAGAVAWHRAPVVAHRRGRGAVAISSQRPGPEPEPGPSGRDRSIVWSRVLVVAPLVSLVVGRGQPGDVLFLDGRQTELLRPLPARYGLADRFDMGPPGAGGPRSRRRGWRPA